MKHKSNIAVVGAGMTGALAAIFLAKRGYDVDMFEVRPDLRKVALPAGRSINMALSERGIHAMRSIGIFDQIQKHLVPMKGRMIHALDGQTHFQPYGTQEHEVIYSISRNTLNTLLLDAAENFSNIRFHFQHKCQWYDFENKTIHFDNLDDENRQILISPKAIIAADGAFSHLRKSMLRLERFNYSQEYLEYGYKELTIPPVKGKHAMEANALHIWPRKQFMLIALPNLDGSFTCTLFMPLQGNVSFDSISDSNQAQKFFSTYFSDALSLMPNLSTEYTHHPIGSLLNIQCFPWNYKGDLILLGDAAHSMTPFFGQGMNSSFEDCQILDEVISKFDQNFEKAFPAFSSERKKDTDAISKMSYENFVEMRDDVANETFRRKKQLEHDLEQHYPELFRSRYSRVSFTRESYADVYKQGIKNEVVLQKLLELNQPIQNLDAKQIQALINSN
jgi:kynurenine 3-monooxygenase